MMAITTSNSISVNPLRPTLQVALCLPFIASSYHEPCGLTVLFSDFVQMRAPIGKTGATVGPHLRLASGLYRKALDMLIRAKSVAGAMVGVKRTQGLQAARLVMMAP